MTKSVLKRTQGKYFHGYATGHCAQHSCFDVCSTLSVCCLCCLFYWLTSIHHNSSFFTLYFLEWKLFVDYFEFTSTGFSPQVTLHSSYLRLLGNVRRLLRDLMELNVMRSLHDTATWYKIRHAGWQKNAIASKTDKAISTSQAWLFFVLDVPLRSLPSRRADFIPCGSFMQRAHWEIAEISDIPVFRKISYTFFV